MHLETKIAQAENSAKKAGNSKNGPEPHYSTLVSNAWHNASLAVFWDGKQVFLPSLHCKKTTNDTEAEGLVQSWSRKTDGIKMKEASHKWLVNKEN